MCQKPQKEGQVPQSESSGDYECWVLETKAFSCNCISGEEGAGLFATSIKEQLLILSVPFFQEVKYIEGQKNKQRRKFAIDFLFFCEITWRHTSLWQWQ